VPRFETTWSAFGAAWRMLSCSGPFSGGSPVAAVRHDADGPWSPARRTDGPRVRSATFLKPWGSARRSDAWTRRTAWCMPRAERRRSGAPDLVEGSGFRSGRIRSLRIARCTRKAPPAACRRWSFARADWWSLPAPPPEAVAVPSEGPVDRSGRGGDGTPSGSPAVREAPRLRRFHPGALHPVIRGVAAFIPAHWIPVVPRIGSRARASSARREPRPPGFEPDPHHGHRNTPREDRSGLHEPHVIAPKSKAATARFGMVGGWGLLGFWRFVIGL
jgi:hypothetical protein